MTGPLAEILFRLKHGPVRTLRWITTRLTDAAEDRRFGIETSTQRSTTELGFDSPDYVHYQPVTYRDLREIFALLQLQSHDVFLDLGGGMGRAVCLAATHPVKSVLGVDISPELCAIARRNLERIAPKIQSRQVAITQSDAAAFEIPRETSVTFLFNPFSGSVLQQVLENIRDSLAKNPRQLRLLFCGTLSTLDFAVAARNHPWLTLSSKHVLSTGFVALFYVHSPPHLPDIRD